MSGGQRSLSRKLSLPLVFHISVGILLAAAQNYSIENGNNHISPPTWVLPMWIENVPLMWEGSVFTEKSLYVGEIFVGTPPEKYTLIFDTGSGNTVLPQVACKSVSCIKKKLYNSSASTTSAPVVSDTSLRKFPTRSIYIKYGDGDISGSFVRDRVCLGEDQSQCITLNMVQSNRMATNPFALFAIDGVLGLGLTTLSASSNFSFVEQVISQQPGMQRRLSIFLSADGSENTITLGGYDEAKALEEPTWVPIINPERGYWQVSVNSLVVGGIPFDYCDDGTCRAVTDLGSTLFNVPSEIIDRVRGCLVKIVPLEEYTENFDCLENFKDGDVTFGSGDFTITLPSRELMSRKPFKRSYLNGTSQYACTTRIHHVNLPPPLGPKVFILGHPLLRTYYTMYDWERKLIGFAKANQSNLTSTHLRGRHSPPVYIRNLNSTDYYLPHLTGLEEEMEDRLKKYGGSVVAQAM